jgi:hypothetical protein
MENKLCWMFWIGFSEGVLAGCLFMSYFYKFRKAKEESKEVHKSKEAVEIDEVFNFPWCSNFANCVNRCCLDFPKDCEFDKRN